VSPYLFVPARAPWVRRTLNSIEVAFKGYLTRPDLRKGGRKGFW